ncbi:hydrogenase large subunit [Desulfotomaculum arcticum]|uniref:Hydrogenase large subunit n=1 Tax=Desulfotruncus arcticus DSM 17038 TaxID=1121424 RepID=A0A1I2YI04_9FIRM|nr:nickel-dependent hydrogenase large subunit [Desulfotruncus arcticus]SFH25208.1 hydrogenase large subunit [Desulfotomaculum arcticum] [Desulfotruncus arcticus DSM 17038]
MSKQRVMFSPVTRLSGLLSVDVVIENGRVIDAKAGSTMFRGFEYIMRDRKATDAVYLTQRVCGICSLAHGAVASYLLDEIYDNDLSENAQYLRNIMYAADFLQNHIRHFYLFSMPDFVKMPERPPFQGQNLTDARLNPEDNQRLVEHYYEAIKAAQRCHEIVTIFGGKAPHQHSFLHGGVAIAPTADKVNRAMFLLDSISNFVKSCMAPDTELIAKAYGDYFTIGLTPKRLLSFGLFRFGLKNEVFLLKGGVLEGHNLSVPRLDLISESIINSWYSINNHELQPDPHKAGAYSYVIAVKYAGQYYQVGPLARMIINGRYNGGTSTMDRIYARTLETLLITELMQDWLQRLQPGPPPIVQKSIPVKTHATAITDSMRGTLLHSAIIQNDQVIKYNIITPTCWNFSPRDSSGQHSPVESALIGTEIHRPDLIYTMLGRTVRSFDPCLNCGTHVLDLKGNVKQELVL